MAPLAVNITTVVLAVGLGLLAGVLSGVFGVGGGILFVPTLIALGLGQIEAQATSLLAILPTVTVGALNQQRYGQLRARSALVVGLASIAGVEAGARIATALPEVTLRRLFGLLLVVVAVQLGWQARRARARYPGRS
jgi:uncharacterized membrane protein YfcA